MELWKYGLAGIVAPLFWLVVLSVALWLVRRYLPRAERTLFDPVSVTLRRLWRKSKP